MPSPSRGGLVSLFRATVGRGRRAGRPPLRLECLEPRTVPATFTVTTTADSGPGSLRQAILDANATPDTNTIAFAVNGGGAQTIRPASALPTVTRPVTIDGTTEPGYAGVPLVVLNGGSAGQGATGLTITAGNSTVSGLVINGFSGAGVQLLNNGGDMLAGNYIGTDISGSAAAANGEGVYVTSSDNLIGGTDPGAGNLISGNGTGTAVYLDHGSGNVVEGNYVGANSAGAAALSNPGLGIFVAGGSGNTIGGAAPGAGNLVSGNNYGIYLATSNDNLIAGNRVGTDATGSRALGNRLQGIEVAGAGNTIGGTTPGAANLVSGNGQIGIDLYSTGTTGNVVEGNVVGTDLTGAVAIPNQVGVLLDNFTFENVIGGTDLGAGNLISGNQNYGVEILGDTTHGNLVQGNVIGTDVTGTRAVGGQFYGVYVLTGAHDNLIGGMGPGAGNLISGNVTFGVVLLSPANVVQGNFIGTDGSGTAAVGNAIGIEITGPNNTVGGTAAGAGNLISGNGQDGVYVASTSGTLIAGNTIGTDVTGTQPLGNGHAGGDGAGVALVATGPATVGGTAAEAGNLISGNALWGVYLNSPGATVQGNFIGTDASGTQPLGNGSAGVAVFGAANELIGGTAAGAGNLISGNNGYGIEIATDHAPGDTVQGNFIGTDASGTQPLGNASSGVALLNAGGNLIGGTTAAAANVLAANGDSGVLVFGSYSQSNRIEGNFIGTDVSVTLSLGNAADGVTVRNASGNVVGGTADGAGNTIAYNGHDGVLVDGGINDAVLSDLIFASGNLGIELVNGGNTNLAAPQLTSATEDGTQTVVQGVLHGSANSTYTVQLFADVGPDASGAAEGQQLLGTYTVHTDGSGTANFTLVVNQVVPDGEVITATATDAFNNTSEFSNWVGVTLSSGGGPASLPA
jgi:titin